MERISIKFDRKKIISHAITWLAMSFFPYVMLEKNNIPIDFHIYCLIASIWCLSYMIVFYLNYLWLAPKVQMRKGSSFGYILANVLLIVATTYVMHLWRGYAMDNFFGVSPNPASPPHESNEPYSFVFFLRDSVAYVILAYIGYVIRLSDNWYAIQRTQQETEKALAESELQNLRSQLNPHFLLNTLNNIYALITFDSAKAQEAVQELSKLLRHVLYDNQTQFTTLAKEIEFVHNYIELMRIRLSANVKLETTFNVNPESQREIAPLIYISLIENAFKHGVSSTEESYIKIHISEEAEKIVCDIRNSYHPKNKNDKSGSGIGLTQVQRRLELNYPKKYKWTKGISENGEEYFSTIVLYTK